MKFLVILLTIGLFIFLFNTKMKAIDGGLKSWFKFQIIWGPIAIVLIFILLAICLCTGVLF